MKEWTNCPICGSGILKEYDEDRLVCDVKHTFIKKEKRDEWIAKGHGDLKIGFHKPFKNCEEIHKAHHYVDGIINSRLYSKK